MKINEIILFEDSPGIGQPVRSATQAKVTLQPGDEDNSYKWEVSAFDKEKNQWVKHQFTTMDGKMAAWKIANQWFTDTFGRKPKASDRILLDPIRRIASVGAGVFSDVRAHPSQQEIVKREREPGEDHGGVAWINAVMKYNEKNPLGNPWLPYVTEFRTVSDPYDNTRTQTTQMRLEEGESLSVEAIEALANRIFPNFPTLSLRPNINSYTYWIQFAKAIDEVREDIKIGLVKTIKNLKGKAMPNLLFTEDINMLEALQLVNQTASRYGLEHDLHSGNIMVRNTGRGWQPVITDPLA